eukprot:148607-Prymnesium_polylepis.1
MRSIISNERGVVSAALEPTPVVKCGSTRTTFTPWLLRKQPRSRPTGPAPETTTSYSVPSAGSGSTDANGCSTDADGCSTDADGGSTDAKAISLYYPPCL